ncbi:MAG: proteasome assembly chaperone family protein [Candidatus Helarchaeota archaeon]
MEGSDVKIVMKKNYKEVKKPTIIVGLPSTGLVGLISALHIIDTMEMEYCGHIESRQLPPIILIHDNELALPLRIYQKDKLFVIISEISIPTSPALTYNIADKLAEWIKNLDPEYLIILRGNPIPNRIEIEVPNCYGLGTSSELNKIIEDIDCGLMEHGIITGVDALLLWESSKQEIPAITLATDAFPNLPDPGAAAVLIEKLNKILGIYIDPAKLIENAEDLRIKMRDMMRNTTAQQSHLQSKEFQIPPMYG